MQNSEHSKKQSRQPRPSRYALRADRPSNLAVIICLLLSIIVGITVEIVFGDTIVNHFVASGNNEDAAVVFGLPLAALFITGGVFCVTLVVSELMEYAINLRNYKLRKAWRQGWQDRDSELPNECCMNCSRYDRCYDCRRRYDR